MRKRRRIILWSAAVLAVLGMTVWLISSSGPPDPVYNGHRLSEWVAGVGRESDSYRLPSSVDSNAVPYLVWSLKSRDGPIKSAYLNLYLHSPAWLQTRLVVPAPAWERHFAACGILASIGPAARPAIPELVARVKTNDEPGIRLQAISALSEIATRDDAEVINCLIDASKGKDPEIRDTARGALEKIDPEGAAKAREKAAIDAVMH